VGLISVVKKYCLLTLYIHYFLQQTRIWYLTNPVEPFAVKEHLGLVQHSEYCVFAHVNACTSCVHNTASSDPVH